jgi:hypothetical protein
MTTLATRIIPRDADEAGVRRQWALGSEPGESRAVLLRMPSQDPLASDHIARLFALTPARLDKIASEWAAAQLAADATLIGMAIGVRVVLVPEGGRWFADLLVIRTRRRLRDGRGSRDPERALSASSRRWTRSLRCCVDTEGRTNPREHRGSAARAPMTSQ